MRDRGLGAVWERIPGKQWAGQIDLGMVDGKRKRVTVYGRTKRIVETKIKVRLRQLDETGDLPTTDVTVEKWLTYWLDTIAAKRLKPNTYRSYRTSVKKHLIPAIGKHKVGSLTAAHIRAMHDCITDTLELSSTTAHNAHRILSIALNDGVRDGRLPRNVAGIVRAPAKAENQRTNLTVTDAVKILKASADDSMGTRWLAALTTGMRQGERLGLRWSMLDLSPSADDGTPRAKADLAWALQRVSYRHGCVKPRQEPTCGKRPASCPARQLSVPAYMAHVPLAGNLVLMRPKTTRSRRTVALIEPLRLALLRRLDVVEAQRPDYKTDHDLVWCHPDGSPIDPRQDWQDWKTLLEGLGISHVTGHEARHTTATLLLEGGAPPRVVEELLGHTQAVTTQGYQHVSLALQRDALEGLGRRLELC